MTTTVRPMLIAVSVLTACEFRGNSVGKEIPEMQGDSGTETSSTGDDGASGNMNPNNTTSMDDAPSNDSTTEDGSAGDGQPVGCDLGDYMESIGNGNWICGYTPFNENLQLTHDCITSWNEGEFNALWTRPEQPIAEAVHGNRTVETPFFEWYEHDSGTITTWTCSDIVETPDCAVTTTEMCLTCVDAGAPSVVCEP